jgi:hypothetical protein
MRLSRILGVMALALAALAMGSAQSWSDAYDKALTAAKSGKWGDARQAFLEAKALRPEDQSGPTRLPGPVTEPKQWRGGASYSPNFGAAYSGYRQALLANDGNGQSELLKAVAVELETLLNKGQNSPQSFFFLSQIYARQRNIEAQRKLEEKFKATAGKLSWKVDTDFLSPEEIAAIATANQAAPTPGNPTTVNPGTSNPNTTVGPGLTSPLTGRVPTINTKFALVIGNSESAMADGKLAFAATDAMLIREALVQYAGYEEGNVDVVTNATAQQILKGAQALSARIPDGATVTVFFAGVGVNIDGKDYLGGIDTERPDQTSSMLAKADLYQTFMSKGARLFAFFEVNRPVVNGRYFGMEVPMVGSIAQMQSTSPGDTCLSVVKDGKTVGLFAKAMAAIVTDFKSNRIPITEFGWQVFYNIRRGDTGQYGVGSHQTPTLPVLTNMASDARF